MSKEIYVVAIGFKTLSPLIRSFVDITEAEKFYAIKQAENAKVSLTKVNCYGDFATSVLVKETHA